GEFQAGICKRMRIFGDRNFVVKAPSPLALPAQKVVDHSLHDLTEAPAFTRNRIFETLLPLCPRVLLLDCSRFRKPLPASIQSLVDGRAQLSRERGDRLFDVYIAPVDLLASEQ